MNCLQTFAEKQNLVSFLDVNHAVSSYRENFLDVHSRLLPILVFPTLGKF